MRNDGDIGSARVDRALKAKLPPNKRESHSFRVREDLPVTLDARGRARFIAMLYVPKAEASLDYSVRVDVALKGGQPAAQIISMQRGQGRYELAPPRRHAQGNS